MEQQWNEGLPPKGEAFLCVVNLNAISGSWFCLWNRDAFGGSAYTNPHDRSAKAAIERPGRHQHSVKNWRYATESEMRSGGCTEEQIAKYCHPSQREGQKDAVGLAPLIREQQKPWYPPQQEGFGPWIEYGPNEFVPPGRIGFLYDCEREDRRFIPNMQVLPVLEPFRPAGVVAYCIQLSATQSTTAQQAADKAAHDRAQCPVNPEAYVWVRLFSGHQFKCQGKAIDWAGVASYELLNDDNAMKARDLAGAEKPSRPRPIADLEMDTTGLMEVARNFRDSRVAQQAFVEWPRDHRCGSWGL
jgi:hypothetical protein